MGFNSGFKGLNRKDWLTLSCTVTWGLKGLTCTLDGWYYRARQKHRQQSRAPGPFRNARPRYSVPASALSGRHCPWHQPPLNYTSPASFYKHAGDVTIFITPNNIHYISTCIHVLGQWYMLKLNTVAKNATVFRGCFNPPQYIGHLLFNT
jgi:hypothetical protein